MVFKSFFGVHHLEGDIWSRAIEIRQKIKINVNRKGGGSDKKQWTQTSEITWNTNVSTNVVLSGFPILKICQMLQLMAAPPLPKRSAESNRWETSSCLRCGMLVGQIVVNFSDVKFPDYPWASDMFGQPVWPFVGLTKIEVSKFETSPEKRLYPQLLTPNLKLNQKLIKVVEFPEFFSCYGSTNSWFQTNWHYYTTFVCFQHGSVFFKLSLLYYPHSQAGCITFHVKNGNHLETTGYPQPPIPLSPIQKPFEPSCSLSNGWTGGEIIRRLANDLGSEQWLWLRRVEYESWSTCKKSIRVDISKIWIKTVLHLCHVIASSCLLCIGIWS